MKSKIFLWSGCIFVQLLIFSISPCLATDQLYRTYNGEDIDGDGYFGGSAESTAPSTPTQRSELPIDTADAIGGENFNPDADDPADPADNLDNNLDGDIDGTTPAAPTLSVFDFAVEIPGNLIDDNGDFQVDETPSPSGPVGSGIVKTLNSGETLKLGFRAVDAYTTLQAFPTGASLEGGFEPLVPGNDSSFSDFYGNIEWIAGDPGIWTFRIFAFNGAGIDSKEFMVQVLPDYRPDAIVGPSAGSGTGDGIYGATGSQQTFAQTSRRAKTRRAFFTLQNDGVLDDSFLVQGTGGNSIFKISYVSSNSGNATGQIIAGNYTTNVLSSGESEIVTSTVKPARRKVKKVIRRRNGKRKVKWKRRTYTQILRSESIGDSNVSDANRFVVRHR